MRGSRRDLARAQQHSLATLRPIGDGVVTVDRHLRVSYANPVALRLAGGRPLLGQGLRDAFALEADGLARLRIAIQECLRHGRVVRLLP